MTLGATDDYGQMSEPVDHPRSAAISRALLAASEATGNRALATMLYGSYARRTENRESDIDILQLVTRVPSSFELDKASITQYTPASLRILAREGSLFVLHLRTEGQIVSDKNGILKRALDEYREPENYSRLKQELAIAAAALNPSLTDAEAYLHGLARLGIYLLRTAAYVKCIELGERVFEISRIGDILGDDELIEAIGKRRHGRFSGDDLGQFSTILRRYLPGVNTGNVKSVQELAVRHANVRHASALLSNVLTGSDRINYTALTLPPL